jgi:hypothetical protein
MSVPTAPVVRPAVGGKAVELVSQALLITAVPAALGPHDYGTLALMLGVATVASSALSLGGPAAVSLLVSAAPADRQMATARALAVRGLLWRLAAVLAALAVALAAGAPVGAATLLALAAALDGIATTAAQATLAVGRPWAFALRWPVQNFALVIAALAVNPGDAEAAGVVLVVSTLAAALFTAGPGLMLLREGGPAPSDLGAAPLAWRLGLAGGLMQLQQRGAIPVAVALGVSDVQAGCAAVAVGAAVALTTAVVQLFQLELPVAARRVAAGHGAAVRDRATALALGAVAGGAGLALAGVIAGPLLIDVVLGDDFESAGKALAPALAAVPLAPVAALGVNHALLAGQPTVRIFLSAAGAAAFGLAAVLLLGGDSDAWDVSIATFAGALAAATAAAIYARPARQLTAAAGLSAAVVWGVGALVA